VHRTEVFELIQYAPSTETVREVPLRIVPPTINKYYAWDLASGRSILEWFVAQGMQVFKLSWHNPTAEQADLNLDTYAGACVDAGRAVRRSRAWTRFTCRPRAPAARSLRRPSGISSFRAGLGTSPASACSCARSTDPRRA
jgi:Poly-beta-hydroxybutyrate polymerase (PhaC) N-terminus